MKQSKQIVKRIVDLAMIVLLPLLMAEVLIGQEIHEWLGAVMLVLFLTHHFLNMGWWKGFAKGKYTSSRAFITALDLLLLLDMAALCISGIMMSGFVFRFLHISGGMMIARQLHLFASHWGLILMSAHLGMHIEQFFSLFRKMFNLSEKSAARTCTLRIAAIVLSVYGLYALIAQHMTDYLFLQAHFVMFDETKAAVVYFAEIVAMMCLFAAMAYYVNKLLRKAGRKSEKERLNGQILKATAFIVPALVCVLVVVGLNLPSQSEPWQGNPTEPPEESSANNSQNTTNSSEPSQPDQQIVPVEDGFVLIKGGSFSMGSPEDEPWRSADEIQHTVTVSDFYISPYEVRQREYAAVMGNNPSNFSGDDMPVENMSWMDAIAFCNALSEKESLTSVYRIDGGTVTWDRSANGYRLPTEAEWEYACRAGTTTPFNTETSISPEESNYYGEYDESGDTDPTGPQTGMRRVYRGGGWNDFAKNIRSAYRATLPEDKSSFNLGIRLVRNAVNGTGNVVSFQTGKETEDGGKVLIAFFSWGGNTKGIAKEIQSQTGADLFEIELTTPYSDDYNTVLDQAQHDQNIQARPEIRNQVENFEQYDTILLGYPNWWASIPMPIASFLEEYDFSGKTIIPFCSHGGGRFGQSLTAITKLAPDAVMGEPLSVHYSGGSTLTDDIAAWLETNNISTR